MAGRGGASVRGGSSSFGRTTPRTTRATFASLSRGDARTSRRSSSRSSASNAARPASRGSGQARMQGFPCGICWELIPGKRRLIGLESATSCQDCICDMCRTCARNREQCVLCARIGTGSRPSSPPDSVDIAVVTTSLAILKHLLSRPDEHSNRPHWRRVGDLATSHKRIAHTFVWASLAVIYLPNPQQTMQDMVYHLRKLHPRQVVALVSQAKDTERFRNDFNGNSDFVPQPFLHCVSRIDTAYGVSYPSLRSGIPGKGYLLVNEIIIDATRGYRPNVSILRPRPPSSQPGDQAGAPGAAAPTAYPRGGDATGTGAEDAVSVPPPPLSSSTLQPSLASATTSTTKTSDDSAQVGSESAERSQTRWRQVVIDTRQHALLDLACSDSDCIPVPVAVVLLTTDEGLIRRRAKRFRLVSEWVNGLEGSEDCLRNLVTWPRTLTPFDCETQGLEKMKQLLKEQLARMRQVPLIQVVGPRGSGKTLLLRRFLDKLLPLTTRPSTILYMDSSCWGKASMNQLLQHVICLVSRSLRPHDDLLGHGFPKSRPTRILVHLLRRLVVRRTILVFDGITRDAPSKVASLLIDLIDTWTPESRVHVIVGTTEPISALKQQHQQQQQQRQQAEEQQQQQQAAEHQQQHQQDDAEAAAIAMMFQWLEESNLAAVPRPRRQQAAAPATVQLRPLTMQESVALFAKRIGTPIMDKHQLVRRALVFTKGVPALISVLAALCKPPDHTYRPPRPVDLLPTAVSTLTNPAEWNNNKPRVKELAGDAWYDETVMQQLVEEMQFHPQRIVWLARLVMQLGVLRHDAAYDVIHPVGWTLAEACAVWHCSRRVASLRLAEAVAHCQVTCLDNGAGYALTPWMLELAHRYDSSPEGSESLPARNQRLINQCVMVPDRFKQKLQAELVQGSKLDSKRHDMSMYMLLFLPYHAEGAGITNRALIANIVTSAEYLSTLLDELPTSLHHLMLQQVLPAAQVRQWHLALASTSLTGVKSSCDPSMCLPRLSPLFSVQGISDLSDGFPAALASPSPVPALRRAVVQVQRHGCVALLAQSDGMRLVEVTPGVGIHWLKLDPQHGRGWKEKSSSVSVKPGVVSVEVFPQADYVAIHYPGSLTLMTLGDLSYRYRSSQVSLSWPVSLDVIAGELHGCYLDSATRVCVWKNNARRRRRYPRPVEGYCHAFVVDALSGAAYIVLAAGTPVHLYVARFIELSQTHLTWHLLGPICAPRRDPDDSVLLRVDRSSLRLYVHGSERRGDVLAYDLRSSVILADQHWTQGQDVPLPVGMAGADGDDSDDDLPPLEPQHVHTRFRRATAPPILPMYCLRGHTDLVTSVEFVPCVERVVTASWFDHSLRLWHAETGDLLCIVARGMVGPTSISATLCDVTGRILVATVHRCSYSLWDIPVDPRNNDVFANSSDAAPATVDDAAPAAVGDATPAAVGDATPAAVGDAALAAVGDATPAAVGDAEPAAVGDAAPAAVGDATPAAVGYAALATVGDGTTASTWFAGAAASVRPALDGDAAAAGDDDDPGYVYMVPSRTRAHVFYGTDHGDVVLAQASSPEQVVARLRVPGGCIQRMVCLPFLPHCDMATPHGLDNLAIAGSAAQAGSKSAADAVSPVHRERREPADAGDKDHDDAAKAAAMAASQHDDEFLVLVESADMSIRLVDMRRCVVLASRFQHASRKRALLLYRAFGSLRAVTWDAQGRCVLWRLDHVTAPLSMAGFLHQIEEEVVFAHSFSVVDDSGASVDYAVLIVGGSVVMRRLVDFAHVATFSISDTASEPGCSLALYGSNDPCSVDVLVFGSSHSIVNWMKLRDVGGTNALFSHRFSFDTDLKGLLIAAAPLALSGKTGLATVFRDAWLRWTAYPLDRKSTFCESACLPGCVTAMLAVSSDRLLLLINGRPVVVQAVRTMAKTKDKAKAKAVAKKTLRKRAYSRPMLGS